jgi:hypothetical protein
VPAVKQFVAVRLGAFASKVLAAEAMNGGQASSTSVERAIRCYLGDKESGGPGWPYPAFLRDRAPLEEVELRLHVDGDLWKQLEAEAESQGVTVQQMLEHAVIYFAAEVNAGRVTERILKED